MWTACDLERPTSAEELVEYTSGCSVWIDVVSQRTTGRRPCGALEWDLGPVCLIRASARSDMGKCPPGWEPLMNQRDTALTLTPGCYTAGIGGNGATQFEVDTEGRVTEILASDE